MFTKAIIVMAILQICYAPPVTKNKNDANPETQTDGLEDYIEYHRYIREVVNALESDPTFRDKLEKANEEDIRTGKIAHELELVSHHVRSRLDEIKRQELERLRDLMAKKQELMGNGIEEDPTHHHIDHVNPHTFEIEDLKKLITKTSEDLAEADRKRRDEFKQYELQKEFEKRDKLNHTSGEEHEKLVKEYREMDEKHKKHEKLHTPGHKQQLEEVWEEQDHMQQDFNPKTFFMLHDLDSNGLWDQDEVKALFIKELDKMYAAGHPEDDMRERIEEMERMRESVFKEMDANRDGFIDYQEFLAQTKKNDYEKDNGWQGIDEQRPFTDEELEAYIRHHQMQYPPPPGMHPNDINLQQYGQGGYHPQQGGYPQVPPGYQNGYPHDQMPPQGYIPQGQMPQQHGQMPNGAYMPQGQMPNQGQMPPPQQGQFHPGQLPQAQVQPQHIQNGNNIHNTGAKVGMPDLNTNEVYRDNRQQQQPPQQQQQRQQVPPQQQQQVPPQQQQQHPPPQQQQQQRQQVPAQQQQQQPPPQQQQQKQQLPPQQQQQQAPPQQQQQQQPPPQQANQQAPQQQLPKQLPPQQQNQAKQQVPSVNVA